MVAEKYTCIDLQTIAASGYSIVTITPASGYTCEIGLALDTDGAGTWRFSEGAAVSGATAITAINNNRKTSALSHCVITRGGEIVTVGTVIGYHVIGTSTGGASKSGGAYGDFNRYVLNDGVTYMMTYQVVAESDVVQSIIFTEREAG